MIRLLKPVDFYLKKYGSALYGLNKMHLLVKSSTTGDRTEPDWPTSSSIPSPDASTSTASARTPPRLSKTFSSASSRGSRRRRRKTPSGSATRSGSSAMSDSPARCSSAICATARSAEQHRERASRLAREQLDDAQSGTGRQFQPDEHRRAVPAPDRTGTVPAGDDRHRDVLERIGHFSTARTTTNTAISKIRDTPSSRLPTCWPSIST